METEKTPGKSTLQILFDWLPFYHRHQIPHSKSARLGTHHIFHNVNLHIECSLNVENNGSLGSFKFACLK